MTQTRSTHVILPNLSNNRA